MPDDMELFSEPLVFEGRVVIPSPWWLQAVADLMVRKQAVEALISQG